MAHSVKHGEWVGRISGHGRSSSATARAVIAAAALTVEEVEMRQRLSTAQGVRHHSSRHHDGNSRIPGAAPTPTTVAPGFVRNPRRNVATHHRFFVSQLEAPTAAGADNPRADRKRSVSEGGVTAAQRVATARARRRGDKMDYPAVAGRPPASPMTVSTGVDASKEVYKRLEEKVVLRPRHHPGYKPYQPYHFDSRRSAVGKRPSLPVNDLGASLDAMDTENSPTVGKLTEWDEAKLLQAAAQHILPGPDGQVVWEDSSQQEEVLYPDPQEAAMIADMEAQGQAALLGALITPSLRRRQRDNASVPAASPTAADPPTVAVPVSPVAAGPDSVQAGSSLEQPSGHLQSTTSAEDGAGAGAVAAPVIAVSIADRRRGTSTRRASGGVIGPARHVRTPSPKPDLAPRTSTPKFIGTRARKRRAARRAKEKADLDHRSREGAGPALPPADGVIRGPALFVPKPRRDQGGEGEGGGDNGDVPAVVVVGQGSGSGKAASRNGGGNGSFNKGNHAQTVPPKTVVPPPVRKASLTLVASGLGVDTRKSAAASGGSESARPASAHANNRSKTPQQDASSAFHKPGNTPTNALDARQRRTDGRDPFAATGVAARAVETAARSLKLPLPSFMKRSGGHVLPTAVVPFANMSSMNVFRGAGGVDGFDVEAVSVDERPDSPAVYLPDTLIPARDHVYATHRSCRNVRAPHWSHGPHCVPGCVSARVCQQVCRKPHAACRPRVGCTGSMGRAKSGVAHPRMAQCPPHVRDLLAATVRVGCTDIVVVVVW